MTRLHRHLRRLLGDQRGGSDLTAIVLLAPATVAVVALLVWTSRQVDAQAQVRTAAESAAQAAARQRDPGAAVEAAKATISNMLGTTDTCPKPTAAVDISGFVPGGTVSVTVSCAPSTTDLNIVQPADATYTATAVAVIDAYKAGPLP